MRNNDKIMKLVTAAVLAAMTCVVTMILPIKIPYGNGGYIHPGDGFVLLSGIILGPVYGGFAAAIGSMLADLLSGYAQYAPITFIIKFLAAALGAISYRKIRERSVILAGILGGIVVTLGYFLYDSFLSGSAAAASAGVPFNLLQNIMGIVIASIILPLLLRVPQIRNIMNL
ncbi:MAG TPA: ECF transporter S component [Clostridiales bacterium]|nr:ECF transporter S component [Clostridiales bacterium]